MWPPACGHPSLTNASDYTSQRSLAAYSPKGCKESDMTERDSEHTRTEAEARTFKLLPGCQPMDSQMAGGPASGEGGDGYKHPAARTEERTAKA